METARERLRELVELFLQKKISVEHFCSTFETVYNLELNKAELSSKEAQAFSALFDRIVWYSPLLEERRAIPNYVGEEEVKAAVLETAQMLAGSKEFGKDD